MRILVAEDEKDLNRVIVKKLTSQGYGVDACFDGIEAINFIQSVEYDVILLDVMMSKADGFCVTSKIREEKKLTPIILLTAKDSVADRVKGLDLGANDYLVKPFSFDELLARIRVMTRQKLQIASNILQIEDLKMDINAHIVTRNDKEIELSAKEYAILEYMMHNQGIVLSREKIENHIWNFDYEGGTNLVNVYIRYLRKKIDSEFEKKLIHTVRGSGYVIR